MGKRGLNETPRSNLRGILRMVIYRKSYIRHDRTHLFTFYRQLTGAYPFEIEFNCTRSGNKIIFKTKTEAEEFIKNIVIPGPMEDVSCRKCLGIIDKLKQDGKIN